MDEKLKKFGKFALLGPYGYLISEGLEKSSNEMNKARTMQLEKLKEEAIRQDIMMQFQKHQARVAQELAIAERISNAEEVEIEEFYDISGKAEAGLKGDLNTNSVSFGIEGEGRKVTRRVYRFRSSLQKKDITIDQNQLEDTSLD